MHSSFVDSLEPDAARSAIAVTSRLLIVYSHDYAIGLIIILQKSNVSQITAELDNIITKYNSIPTVD